MTDDFHITARLRAELAAAADKLPSPASSAPAGFLRRADRRRRATLAVKLAALPVAAVVVVLVGAVALLPTGGETSHVDVADDVAGMNDPPTVRDALDGADRDAVGTLSPLRRPTVTAVTGGFIVWGGEPGDTTSTSGTGALYMEATDSWQILPPSPLRSRVEHASVWTGGELILAGGATTLSRDDLLSDVAAYDPETETWRRLGDLPEPRAAAHAVYAAGRIVVAGGDTLTEAASSTVLVGDGQGDWSAVTVDHPVLGALATNSGVVVYGFEGERAPLELSLVDPATATARTLPRLAPSDHVAAEYVGELAIGARDDELSVVLGADGAYVLHGLDLAEERWVDITPLATDEQILTPSRMLNEAGGELVLGQTTTSLITRRAVYEIDPASGRVQQQVDFDDRCAGNRLIDDAATFGTSDRSTLFWIDQSCDGERGLGGREGAHLMTPGTDG